MNEWWKEEIRISELAIKRVQRYQARNRSKGLCRDCPKKAVEGRTYCEYHLEKRRQYSKENRKK